MRTGLAGWSLCVALMSGVALLGCAQPEPETVGAEEQPGQLEASQSAAAIWLSLAEESPTEVVVDLHFRRGENPPGPRMMELLIARSEQLALLGSEPLGAALDAGKRAVVQETSEGRLRVVIMASDNLNEIPSGALVRIRLGRPRAGAATLSLVDRRPFFAPAAAVQEATLGEPLVVSAL